MSPEQTLLDLGDGGSISIVYHGGEFDLCVIDEPTTGKPGAWLVGISPDKLRNMATAILTAADTLREPSSGPAR